MRTQTILAAALAFLAAGSANAREYTDWGTAEPVTAINTAAAAEGCPIESPDGRFLYMASNRTGGEGKLDLYRTRRSHQPGDWGMPANLGPSANSAEFDYCPTPLHGNWLLFVSSRQTDDDCFPGDTPPAAPPGGPAAGDIFLTREHPMRGWEQPLNLGCFPNGPNTAGAEFSPSLVHTREGTFLFFSSNGYPDSHGHDIYMSRVLPDGTVEAGKRVAELSSPATDYMPNVRPDGLEIVLSSTRDTGNPDIYVATRRTTASEWSTPVRIDNPSINTAGAETRPSLSADGTRLYFGRKVDSSDPGDVFVSTRLRVDRGHKQQ